MFSRRVLITTALGFACLNFVSGQTATGKDNVLEVTAPRVPVSVETVIDSLDIGTARTTRTADDLLTATAGVDVQRTSPGGSKGTGVTIRGFDESRSLILLNGRPLNGTGVMGGHYVDWSSISTEDIERIELIRGGKTAEYGNTLGGMVNIVTKKGTRETKTTMNATYGTFNTVNAAITHKGGIRSFLLYDFSGAHWQTDGFLRNNSVDRNTISGRLSLLLPHTVVELGGRISVHNRGFIIENRKEDSLFYDADFPESDGDAGGGPGIKWDRAPDSTFGDGSYWTNIREQYDVNLQHFRGRLQLDAHAYLNDQDRTEYFYAITDENRLIYERFAKPEDNTGGWHMKARYPLAGHEFKAGLEGSYLNYDGTKINSMDSAYFSSIPTESEKVRAAMRHAAFLQDHWKIHKNAAVDLGLRYDAYLGTEREDAVDKTERSGFSPKLGITCQAWEGGEVAFHGGRSLRFPSCPELYWYYSGYDPETDSIDRKELSPEDAFQYELSAEQRIGTGGMLAVRGYYYDVTDYIRTIFGYPPSRVVYNIDRVTFTGIECEARYALLKGLSLSMNYTYQVTEKEGDLLDLNSALTDNLPELPEHKGNILLAYAKENGIKAQLKCRMIGERRVIIGNLARAGGSVLETLDPFIVVNVYGAYPVYRRGRFSGTLKLGIENLFNTEYEEEYGFPMPGITLNGGVNVAF